MFWRVDRSCGILLLAGVLFAGLGCGDDGERPQSKPPAATKPASEPAVEGKRVPVGQNVYLEVMRNGQRRVLISARICLREGPLELLLTRRGTKEHESILTADVDARKIHEALLLANAKPGSPVRFEPRFRPPTGTPVKISLIYQDGNQKVMVPARSWVRNSQTGKELESDWVFAGSMLVDNPLESGAPKRYLANEGDLICVANFETALLDVSIQSSKSWDERRYEAWTDRIPKEASEKDLGPAENPKKGEASGERLGTVVVVVLEPVLPARKK